MKLFYTIFFLGIFSLVSCGSEGEQNLSSLANLDENESEQKLCVAYSGKWTPKAQNKNENTDELIIRGSVDRKTSKCRFKVTNAKGVELSLAMDGKDYESELEKNPIIYSSEWTNKDSLDADGKNAKSEKTNITFKLRMVSDLVGIKYTMTSESLIVLEGRDKLRLQAVTHSKPVVAGEEDQSQPVERFDETYYRGNWEE